MKNILHQYQQLSPRKKNVFTWLVFAIITFALYGKTLSFNYCIDDQYYLWLFPSNNGLLIDYFQSILQRFWGQQFRPITYLTILLEAIFFGEVPLIHHITNLLYYSLLCFVIFKVIKQFFNNTYKNVGVLAFFVTILFLLHPSHANIVPSIKNREVILSLMFGLLALSYWLKYIHSTRIKFALFSILFLLLGIYSKKDIATFLIIIPIVGWLYNQSKLKTVNHIISNICFILVVAFSMALIENLFAAPITSEFIVSSYENEFINNGIRLYERIPYAFQILAIYEKFMMVPFGYHFYFGVDTIQIHNQWKVYPMILLLIHFGAILGYIYYCFKNKITHRLFGAVLFFLSLAPFCISFATGYVAVRYSFIASLGFCIILSQIILSAFNYTRSKKTKAVLYFSIFILCIIWSWFSFQRSLDWKDLDTLYQADLPKIKQSANANRMAATYYYLEAEKTLDQTSRIELLNQSQGYADQALKVYYPIEPVMIYKAKGLLLLNQRNEAVKLYLDVAEYFPNNIEALEFLAYEFKKQSNYSESINYFERITQLSPENTDVFVELTQIYIYFNQFDKAIALNQSFYKNGNHYEALLNFGDIFIGKRDTTSALINYNQAIDIKQEDFIIDELLNISKSVKNDTMVLKLEKMKFQY